MKKVSVIVPVWNVEKYISKCLDSLVNQTLEEIEIIIVNDGSPDNSQKIIDEYVEKYPNKIKSFIIENGGQGAARNFGLTKAIGEYIGFVDSDDYVNKEMFKKMYNKAISEKLDIVITPYNNIFEDTKKEKVEQLFLKTNDDKINAFFNNVGVCNKLYKRELLNGIIFKSKVWYEDLAFSCKVIMNAKKIGYINEGLYNYFIHNGSTMNNNNIYRNLEICDAFDDILNYMKKHKKFNIYYDEVEYLAIYHIFIATIVRIINVKGINKKDKKKIIIKIRKYFEENFPKYKKNKYIRLLDKNKKVIYNLIKHKLYFFVKMIFIIKNVII